MNEKETKHMIGALIVFLVLNALINGFFGKVIFVIWVASLIYAKISKKLVFKEHPSFTDYFDVHIEAVKFSVGKIIEKVKK